MSLACRGSSKMLLCVDNSHGVLEYERALFERSGFTVVTAASARDGLRLAARRNFDVVLLDYHLPDMNGRQLASELRRIRPETPVVMFSGDDMIAEETRHLVDAVISKNKALEELLPTVTRLCSRISEA